MKIRDYQPSDLPQLQAVHAGMGIDYAVPNFDSPLFIVRKVAVDDNGKILAALMFKLRAEAMLLAECDPATKMLAMNELQREALPEAFNKGLDEVDAAVPDFLEFDKRLAQLGWTPSREGWTVWTFDLEASLCDQQ